MDLIIGRSQPIQRLKNLIKQVADTGLNVLVCGESGVGKELVARSLHGQSNRSTKPFVKVNCAALPGELLESELFGYEKGAFTGASEAKPGKFEIADKGAIFLDEIGDMSLSLQAKLLQVLQDSEFCRVGGIRDVKVDVWVICATHHDLEVDIQKGHFREDLFYRINIIKIKVPPLRERKEDIPLLVNHFLEKYMTSLNRNPADLRLSQELFDCFSKYHWPGNVRELENYIQKLMVLGDEQPVIEELESKNLRGVDAVAPDKDWDHEEYLLDSIISDVTKGLSDNFPSLKDIKKKAQARAEKVVIEEALRRTAGNKRDAAKLLQISYKAILYKIRDYGINVEPGEFLTNSIQVTIPRS
ncbi:MAG: sigma-54-dependent Fis family transcriptional regulator [Thermodesulfatator sp.]|nr:MAG: sigma-54-dependent Fis family transcriptional regulator [Thermodesulfatator sp.]